MRSTKGAICIFLIFFYINVDGQYQNEIDSIQKRIQLIRHDTIYINSITQLAFFYSFTDSIKTIQFADEAIILSNQYNFKPGLANALRSKANYFIVKRTPQKAIPFIQQERLLLDQIKRTPATAANHLMMGQAKSLSGNQQEALEEYKKAESLFQKLGNKEALSIIYNNVGSLYNDKYEFELAISYFIKSIQIQESLKDFKTIGATQNNIGRLFYQTKNYPKAIEYFNKSIEANSIVKDWRNLGITHINIANIYIEQANYPNAIEELDKSLIRFKQVDFKRGIQICYNNLGAIFLRQENYEKAIPFLNNALDIARANQTQAGVALIEQNIAYSYAGIKNYSKALEWYKKAENTATISAADQFTFGEIYNHRSSLDSMMGNYSSALIYRTKYMQINEKTIGNKVIREVNELQTKYETEKKDFKIILLNKSDSIKSLAITNQQLAINKNLFQLAQQNYELANAELKIVSDSLLLSEQNKLLIQKKLDSSIKEDKISLLNKQNRINQLEVAKKNNLIIIVLTSVAFVLMSAYLIYRRNELKQEQSYQKELLIQQEKATVDIIAAEEKERKRIASDLHDGVGQLMSAAWMNLQALTSQVEGINDEDALLIQKSLALVDESCKEVRQVSHNMMPNALLMKGLVNAVREFIGQIDHRSLNINLTAEGIDFPLPSHVETVLYRVIQESVNNVIKHAKASELDISILLSNDGIDVMIEDNGLGFDPNKLSSTAGIGLENIRSRIQFLKGTVEWNTSLGKGTLVSIFIPPIQLTA